MSELPAQHEIDRIAENILRDSKSFGVFPTPIQNIIEFTELKIDEGVDLSTMHHSFLANLEHAMREKARMAMSKILGAIDIRKRTIYLDLSQHANRQRFVQLHETGHHALPWQTEIFCIDDEQTLLDPDVKNEFEREASYFASAILFQNNVFDFETGRLPLSLTSAMHLSDKFGASKHAAIRRYVERSPKRCALLVLEKPSLGREFTVPVRDYFQSQSFSEEFGQIFWPPILGLDHPFVQEVKRKRKFHEDGLLTATNENLELVPLKYHYFCNTFNTFVFMFPQGEKNRSRVKIITT